MLLWPLCEGTARWYWFPCACTGYHEDDDDDDDVDDDDDDDGEDDVDEDDVGYNDEDKYVAHTWIEWHLYSWS